MFAHFAGQADSPFQLLGIMELVGGGARSFADDADTIAALGDDVAKVADDVPRVPSWDEPLHGLEIMPRFDAPIGSEAFIADQLGFAADQASATTSSYRMWLREPSQTAMIPVDFRLRLGAAANAMDNAIRFEQPGAMTNATRDAIISAMDELRTHAGVLHADRTPAVETLAATARSIREIAGSTRERANSVAAAAS